MTNEQTDKPNNVDDDRRKIEHLVACSNDMIALFDREFVHVLANSSYLSAFGMTQDEIVGRCAEEILPEAFFELIFKPNAERCMTGRIGRWTDWFEFPGIGNRYVEVEYTPYKDKSDEIQGFAFVARDITNYKQVLEENEKLAGILKNHRKTEGMTGLAGKVAHDFNNAVSSIFDSAGIAAEDLSESDSVHMLLKEIIEYSKRSSDLTRQMLALSKQKTTDAKVIDFGHMVENLHSLLAPLLGNDITLRALPTRSLGRITADPNQIHKLLLYLGINGRNAMPDGGELVFETANIKLNENFCDSHKNLTPGNYVMLSVSDTGDGISQEIREKIFEPFCSAKQHDHETGLGLSTVSDIVDQCGGAIEIISVLGKGTQFKIYFPTMPDKDKSLTESELPLQFSTGETILLVEDELMVRNLAVRLLERLGYDVLAAASGGQGLVLAHNHDGPIQLLLTDVVMPIMNGCELSERLSKQRPEIKTLFTSGYAGDVIAEHGLAEQDVGFIAKPYTLETLAARIREVLDGEPEE